MAQTVAITEGTGHVVLTFSGGKVKHIPKTGFSVTYDPNSGDQDKVILSWASGENQSKYDFERLNYLNVSSPSLANDQALVDLLVGYAVAATSGGGGGAGGGSIVYTNAAGDFIATPTTGAKTITITGLPFTLEEVHLMGGSIKKRDASNVITALFSGTEDYSISGGVITLADADNFVATDEVYITLIGPDKWYDRPQDGAKTLVQNPEWAHYTDVEHIVDDSNATVDQHYSPAIPVEGYRNIAFQFTGSSSGSGVTFKIYGTLNPSAALPADGDAAPSTDWVDMGIEIIGTATKVLDGGNSAMYFVDTSLMLDRYIIQYEPDNATNETDVFIRKY
jgi:hypothetical protein